MNRFNTGTGLTKNKGCCTNFGVRPLESCDAPAFVPLSITLLKPSEKRDSYKHTAVAVFFLVSVNRD